MDLLSILLLSLVQASPGGGVVKRVNLAWVCLGMGIRIIAVSLAGAG